MICRWRRRALLLRRARQYRHIAAQLFHNYHRTWPKLAKGTLRLYNSYTSAARRLEKLANG